MKYCQFLIEELTFNLDQITPCCNCFSHNAPEYYNFKNEENLEDINIFDTKKKLIQKINENIENFSCVNCIHLKDDNPPHEHYTDTNELFNKKYSSIYLRHWTTCNSNCIHCDNHRANIFGKAPKYNPYNVIKKAYENNLIDTNNLVIRFHGGDLGVLENFAQYIDLFEQYGFKTIHFSTNNIIYQPKIEQILKQGKGSLNISIDSGTSETYQKIKRVDKFNDCIENLKKYLSAGIHPHAICIHYIIIQGFNDNKKEINTFLKLMKDLGISTVGVRIDHKDLDSYLLGNAPIKIIDKYKELVTYFYDEASKQNLILDNDLCLEQNFVLKKQKKDNFGQKFKSFYRIFNKK